MTIMSELAGLLASSLVPIIIRFRDIRMPRVVAAFCSLALPSGEAELLALLH